MRLPDDYGLSPVRTLAHVGDPSPSGVYSPLWSAWSQAVSGLRPVVRTRAAPADDPGATHEFESLGHARIGCRWEPPEGPVRAVAVLTHGYGTREGLAGSMSAWSALRERGVGVLGIRVRGYPGSRSDTPPPGPDEEGYAARGLVSACGNPELLFSWILVQAAADVALALRAARSLAPAGVPAMLIGESFGAGLALAAASHLAGPDATDRIVLALPSLGDWKWRFAHEALPGTAGRHVRDAVRRLARGSETAEEELLESVRAMDSVLHAARVRCPALCMLAERDEVVPAPTAAAVYNALGSEPGRKWRFVVPCGHFDAGLANARRHAAFRQCALDFLDPSKSPEAAMARWEPELAGPGAGA